MEKKNTIISLIFVTIIIAGVVFTIIVSGITTKDYNYVQLEVNPRVEFICDKKFKVISYAPLNTDARIILSDMDLVGKDIEEATTLFLKECSKTGYIDVNGINNASNITVLDGITQALDVHIMQSIYNYFRNNEIMASVTETYEDRKMFDEKKKNNISCVNKFKLISTIDETRADLNFDTLKNMNEVSLINLVADYHKNNPYTPTTEEINTKNSLLEKNQNKYNTHVKSITKNTQKEFSELFDNFQKASIKEYQENFKKQYDLWQKNKSI